MEETPTFSIEKFNTKIDALKRMKELRESEYPVVKYRFDTKKELYLILYSGFVYLNDTLSNSWTDTP